MAHHRPVALITGASRGIGNAIAATFAENGYDMILLCKKIEICLSNSSPT